MGQDWDARDLPLISAHPGELNQVWTNLVDNAVDALPAGGELRVETARETTKGVGDGTGLGLDIAQRIIRQHAGQLDVESRPGRTVFTVRLPLAVR